ncbi:MAG: hypothetical protein ACLU93_01755 [Streptococcus sp.]
MVAIKNAYQAIIDIQMTTDYDEGKFKQLLAMPIKPTIHSRRSMVISIKR